VQFALLNGILPLAMQHQKAPFLSAMDKDHFFGIQNSNFADTTICVPDIYIPVK